jgi:FixJ family two-component response regulator
MNNVNQREAGGCSAPSRAATQAAKGRLGIARGGSATLVAESAETLAQLENLVDEAKTSTAARGTIHVVDDDYPFATAICRLLRAHGFATRIYANAGEFLLAPIPDTPGCILMDVCLPGPSGLELQAALAAREIPLPIIFVSGHADVPTSVRAMKTGALDFLTKPVDRETLLAAVRSALAQSVQNRRTQERLRIHRARYETLTRREQEVFAGVVAGKLNKQIAGELGAAERTIKAHRAQVMHKMRVSCVAELVHIAGHFARTQTAPRRTSMSGTVKVPAFETCKSTGA